MSTNPIEQAAEVIDQTSHGAHWDGDSAGLIARALAEAGLLKTQAEQDDFEDLRHAHVVQAVIDAAEAWYDAEPGNEEMLLAAVTRLRTAREETT